MKVAIVSENMELTGLVPRKFKDAEYMMIIDADTNVLTRVYPREDAENIGFAHHVVEEDCEVLICGELEKEPFEIIAGAMVTRYDGSTKKVQRAYDYMKRGQLSVIRDHVGGTGEGHSHDFSCDCGEEHEEEPESREYVFDAVISAAGLSSRMGDYKPLMDLGGKTVIQRMLETFMEAGVRTIHLVGGHRFEELQKAALECCPKERIHFHENVSFATTEMLDSARIGFEACMKDAKPADGVYFVPVDVPLFTKFTLGDLADWFSMSPEEVYRPVCEGKGGHPLLIRGSALGMFMDGDDSEGLRSIMAQPGIHVRDIDEPDWGATLDADTQEEFEKLIEELEDRKAPADKTCLRILNWAGVMEEGLSHARMVAKTADEICEACGEAALAQGITLNKARIHGAAMLHDVLKGMNNHEKRGAELLRELGMPEVAALVETHNELSEEQQLKMSENLVVYLADKMVSGCRKVSVMERFAEKEKLFAGNRYAMEGLRKRKKCAEQALATAISCGWKE